MSDDKGRNDLLALAGFVVIVILISAVGIAVGIPASSGWSASNTTSTVGVVTASTTWTTTNQYGVTVTYSTVYTTTSGVAVVTGCMGLIGCTTTVASTATSTNSLGQLTTATTSYTTTGYLTTYTTTTSPVTTTSPGTPWLTLTLHGSYQITDANGNIVYTNTFAWAPIGGSGNGTNTKYDITYDVEGEGIDWSTLQVNVNVNGVAAQPSASDPNTAQILNTVPNIDSASAGTRSGHLGKIVPIDTVLGGKSFDKARPLTTSIAASATATAKIAPGYALAGYTALESDVGPVAGLSSMNWKEATSTSAPVTPTPVTTTTFYNNNVVKENEKQSCQSNNSCKGTPTAEQRISSFTKAGMAGSNAFSFLGALGISQPMIIVGADTTSGLIDYTTASYVAVLLIIIITISILIIAFKRKRD